MPILNRHHDRCGRAQQRRARAPRAFAIGAFASGACAFGAVAIARLAVRRAAIDRMRIKELHIDHLIVEEIEVHAKAGECLEMPDQHSDSDQNPATAPTGGGARVVTKISAWSVADTVARLSAVVTERGMKVFAVIDHSGEAEAIGLELRDTKLVIFGSPQAGTPVMQAAPLAALDLPLRVLVWAETDQTKLSYTAPVALATRYGLSDELAARLAGIDAVTDTVISR